MENQNENKNVNGQEADKPETPQGADKNAATPTEKTKETLGAKLKRHWKGVAAGAAALLVIGGSAFAAHRRGKAAAYAGTEDDFTVNPNE